MKIHNSHSKTVILVSIILMATFMLPIKPVFAQPLSDGDVSVLIQSARSIVNSLVQSGELTSVQATRLKKHLHSAQFGYSAGDFSTARVHMNSFVNGVQWLMEKGSLSISEGETLVSLGTYAISLIPRGGPTQTRSSRTTPDSPPTRGSSNGNSTRGASRTTTSDAMTQR